MTFEEFVGWTRNLVEVGELGAGEADDLVSQRSAFEEVRTSLATEFDQQVVGFQNGQLLVADSVGALMTAARVRSPGSLVYFEAIGYDPFGR
jgi:hypothetical protein